MREEIAGARSDLQAKFDAMQREFEIKMAGRPGMGFYESGSIETLKEENVYRKQETTHLIEQNIIFEQKMKDIEKHIDGIKNINEVINNDEKITSMIEKYKEAISEGQGWQSLIKKDRDSTFEEIKKLKDDLDKNVMQMNKATESVKQNTEEDMKAHCIDLTDKIAETKKWVTNYIDNRDGMPSRASLATPNEDKLDMIMMHLKNLEKEGSGKEDKGRQGEDKGKQGNTNNTPQNNIPSQSPMQGHEYYAMPGGQSGLINNVKPGGPPGLINEPSGSGQPQGANNLIRVLAPVQTKLTECFKIHSQAAPYTHLTLPTIYTL